MPDRFDLADDLLRGGGKIAEYLHKDDYAKDPDKTTKRFYHEAAEGMWPVFTLPNSSILHALKSQLREHVLGRAREAQTEIAIASKRAKVESSIAKAKPKRRRSRAGSPQAA